MKAETSVAEPAPAAPARPAPAQEFAVQLGSTPRSASLARRIAVRHLAEWGIPRDTKASHVVALLVSELSANAIRHGNVRGRDFHVRVAAGQAATVIRIEVSDVRAEVVPRLGTPPAPDGESGRGLVLVEALATRWGSTDRDPVGKTVWCEVALPSR